MKLFVERIANALRPQRGSSFEASFDFNKWLFGCSLINEAHEEYLSKGYVVCLSAGLHYLSTYLSYLRKAYAYWVPTVEYRLTDRQRKIARERLTGIAKLQHLVCMAAN